MRTFCYVVVLLIFASHVFGTDEPDEPDVPSMPEPLDDEPLLGLPQSPSSAQRTATATRAAAPQRASSERMKDASVQFMITSHMKAELEELGYTASDIRMLAPERARIIIAHKIRRTSKGVPKEWQRGGGRGRSGNLLSTMLETIQKHMSGLGITGFAVYAVYMADPQLFQQTVQQILAPLRKLVRDARHKPMRLDVQPRRAAVRGKWR